jgi:hypothetical protein
VVHLNIQLLQGATLLKFLVIREEGRTLLNVSYVFSDLHKKACFKCGQLAHLGQYCRAAVKPIAEQGPVWSFMDVPGGPSLGTEEGKEGSEQSRGCDVASASRGVESGEGASGSEGQLLPPYERAASVASTGSPAPPDQEVVEPDCSARLGLGQARVVGLPASALGPPFRVVSGPVSEEAASVALSLPSEPFLYLSPDSQPPEGGPPWGSTPRTLCLLPSFLTWPSGWRQSPFLSKVFPPWPRRPRLGPEGSWTGLTPLRLSSPLANFRWSRGSRGRERGQRRSAWRPALP